MNKLTKQNLDAAIWKRRFLLIDTEGGRKVDTHVEFKPVAKVKSDVCCNGNCSQAHECPRYQPANDESPFPSRSVLVGLVIGFAVAAYLIASGVWQWK